MQRTRERESVKGETRKWNNLLVNELEEIERDVMKSVVDRSNDRFHCVLDRLHAGLQRPRALFGESIDPRDEEQRLDCRHKQELQVSQTIIVHRRLVLQPTQPSSSDLKQSAKQKIEGKTQKYTHSGFRLNDFRDEFVVGHRRKNRIGNTRGATRFSGLGEREEAADFNKGAWVGWDGEMVNKFPRIF